MPRHLHIDPFSGIAGDMFLAGMLDLGADLPSIIQSLRDAGVEEPFDVLTERVQRQGIGGLMLRVVDAQGQPVDAGHAWAHEHTHAHHHHAPHDHQHEHEHEHEHQHKHDHGHDHGDPHHHGHAHEHGHEHAHEHTHEHGHSHHHHAHVGRQELLRIANGLKLTGPRRGWASAVVDALASAEARVHGKSIDEVHFHEVGALDSIVDLLGSMAALEQLDVATVSCGPLPVSRGYVRCAHGRMPVPAPATAYLLEDRAVTGVDRVGEWVTPTGAALVSGLTAAEDVLVPAMRVAKVGYGAGHRDPAETPNLLRLWLGERLSTGGLGPMTPVTSRAASHT